MTSASDRVGAGLRPVRRARPIQSGERIHVVGAAGAGASAAAGSGIGLTIVRDVVTQHGGRVWVEDAPGGGARFVITLPYSVAQMPAEPPALAIAK